MDILIKNMEMPSDCCDCPFKYGCTCLLMRQIQTKGYSNYKRPSDCPLVALPSHGDLIDRDKLYNDTEGIGDYCYDPSFRELCDALYDAPVIVEATE